MDYGVYMSNNGSCIRNGDRIFLARRAGYAGRSSAVLYYSLRTGCRANIFRLSAGVIWGEWVRLRPLYTRAPKVFVTGRGDREHLPSLSDSLVYEKGGLGSVSNGNTAFLSLDSKSVVSQAGQDPPNPYINVLFVHPSRVHPTH
jgi:hypothetical protein